MTYAETLAATQAWSQAGEAQTRLVNQYPDCQYVATSAVVDSDLTSAILNGKLDVAGYTPATNERALLPIAGTNALLGIYIYSGSAWVADDSFVAREGATVDAFRSTGAPTYRQTAPTGSATPVFVLRYSEATAATFAPNNSHIYYSPYNNYVTSAVAAMLSPGAYAKVAVKNTTTVTIGISVAALVAASVAAGNYPKYRIVVDGVAGTETQLTSSTTSIGVSGLSTATHQIKVEFICTLETIERWTPSSPDTIPANTIRITGVTLDTGGTLSAPTLGTGLAVFWGDSTFEGVRTVNNNANPSGNDVTYTVPYLLAEQLGCEYSIIGLGGTGYTVTGSGDVPAFASSQNYYFSGASKLSGGALSPAPTMAFICLGQNDSTTNITTQVTAALTNTRTICGAGCQIYLMPPYSQNEQSYIQAGYDAYVAANPSDAHVYLLDIGTTSYTTNGDGVHPNIAGDATLYAKVSNYLRVARYGLSDNMVQMWDPQASSLITLDESNGISAMSSTVGTVTASQSTPGNRLVLTPGQYSGVPVMRGNSTASRYLIASDYPNLGTPGTLICVCAKLNNTGTYQSIFAGNDLAIYCDDTLWYASTSLGVKSSGKAVAIGSLTMLTIRSTAYNNFSLYTNGGNKVTFTNGGAYPSRGFEKIGLEASFVSAIDYAVLFALNVNPTDAQIANVHANVARDFGITLQS